MVMKEHVTQCNSVAHWCVFNEEEDIRLWYADNRRYIHCWFWSYLLTLRKTITPSQKTKTSPAVSCKVRKNEASPRIFRGNQCLRDGAIYDLFFSGCVYRLHWVSSYWHHWFEWKLRNRDSDQFNLRQEAGGRCAGCGEGNRGRKGAVRGKWDNVWWWEWPVCLLLLFKH